MKLTGPLWCFVLRSATVAVAGRKKKPAPPPPAPPPPPAAAPAPTAELTATPTVISAGDQVQLSWTTTNAASAFIDGIGDVPTSGVKTVTPTESTTYHLVASGEGGTADATARVTVNPPPAVAAPAPTMSEEELFNQNVQPIFFDYDKYDIRSDAQATLSKDASSWSAIPMSISSSAATATSAAPMSTTSPWVRNAPMHQGRARPPWRGGRPHPDDQLRQGEALLHREHRGVLAAESPRRLCHGALEPSANRAFRVRARLWR